MPDAMAFDGGAGHECSVTATDAMRCDAMWFYRFPMISVRENKSAFGRTLAKGNVLSSTQLCDTGAGGWIDCGLVYAMCTS